MVMKMNNEMKIFIKRTILFYICLMVFYCCNFKSSSETYSSDNSSNILLRKVYDLDTLSNSFSFLISKNLQENTKSVDEIILYKNPIIEYKDHKNSLKKGWYYLDDNNVRLIQFDQSGRYLVLKKYDPI